jgi:GNAT superfamily N-acetyltransferase
MPDCIRTADPIADRALLTDQLSRNLSPDAGGHRFDWLYLENPHGRARAWVAIENSSGRGLGVAAAFPRRLLVGDTVRLGYVLGDFCVDPQHRSLGLALQLQRASLEQIVSEPLAIAYDFPSDRMMAIYRRMKVSPTDQIVRWAKPLRADRKIDSLLRSPELARAVAAPLNVMLKWRDFSSFRNSGWTIVVHEGICKEEFTTLAHSVGSRFGSCIERSAAYLNWRYLQHPLVHYEILTARQAGELRGYVVFSHTGKDAKIVDLFGFSDTAMWTSLVARVVALLRERGVVTLSMPALASSPWAGLLMGWGFRPRESAPLVVCGTSKGGTALGEELTDPWFLMDGDRES